MNTIMSSLKLAFKSYISFFRPSTIHPFAKLNLLSLLFLPMGIKALPADSVKYLTLKDTLFIALDEKSGEKIFDHKILKGQTLYSLARFYGLNEEELYPYNPNLKSNTVSIGQVIKVPIPNTSIKRFKGDNFKRWKFAPISFKVKKGDNLYKIAKTLFHMPVDSVVKWNNLPNQTIAPGQVLHVGWISLEGVPDSIRNLRKGVIDLKKKELEAKYNAQKKLTEEKGAAFWQVKGNSNTHYYCLHRQAKPGSIISITNGMNFKTIYAKVIGKIPDNQFGNEVILIVSPSVAKQLGAKDEKFFVKIRYAQ